MFPHEQENQNLNVYSSSGAESNEAQNRSQQQKLLPDTLEHLTMAAAHMTLIQHCLLKKRQN